MQCVVRKPNITKVQILIENISNSLTCQKPEITYQENVKVSAKSLVLVVSEILKSEIRISKLETISNFEYQMTKTFQIVIQYLWSSSRLEIWILVIRICLGFRASCFEFMENRISKQLSLNQQVIRINDVALDNLLLENVIGETEPHYGGWPVFASSGRGSGLLHHT